MPALSGHFQVTKQQQRDSSSSSLSSTPAAHAPPSAIAGVAFASTRSRIYPREYNIRKQKPASPHLSSTTSPLLSALQNPGDLFNRSIPFTSFLSSSSPSSGLGIPNSLGSASGGVILSGGPSPPPSAPASYSSSGFPNSGGSVPRQIRGYPGFEEQYNAPHSQSSAGGGYYNPTHRYASSVASHGSPVTVGVGAAQGQSQSVPGSNGFACELAVLEEAGFSGGDRRAAGGGGDNVVCLGWEAGVDVWRVGRGVVDHLARLDGLKGGVKSAKLLPNPPLNDPLAALRPLICLTIHSPINGAASDEHAPPIMLQNESPYSNSPESHMEGDGSDTGSNGLQWETTVEVWSLSARTRVAKLFTSPPIPVDDNGFGLHVPPPVWGGLKVAVNGMRIVVGVGSSGELYVFELQSTPASGKQQLQGEWQCVDKLWTSVQHAPTVNSSFSSDSGLSGLDPHLGAPPGVPVFALSDCWLAYCPAPAGTMSAGGEVGVPHAGGTILAQAPPSQPSISASVSGEDEAIFSTLAREVTQHTIRGGKWIAETGIKKLQNYWANSAGAGGQPSPPEQGMGYGGLPTPTHAQPSAIGQQLRQYQQTGTPPQSAVPFYGTQSNEPRIVSIVDLGKGAQNSVPPMATFLPPAGVSFLSFAPGGLALLTASSKGDLLYVWDLMKAVHNPPASSSTSSSATAAPEDKKHIRQLARFPRMTVATIVEVAWQSAERLAVVTERGTAHFYDLPSSALSWPPPARPPPPSSSNHPLSAAANLLSSSTQPLLTAARRRRSRSSSVGSPKASIFAVPTAGAARRTGSISVAAGARGGSPPENLIGRDKVTVPGTAVGPGCIQFLTGRERGFVGVLGGGILRIYQLRPSTAKKGGRAAGVGSTVADYDLPMLPSAADAEPAFWGGRGRSSEEAEAPASGAERGDWLSYAEIETNNASWMPWHHERRAKMFVYAASAPPPPPASPSALPHAPAAEFDPPGFTHELSPDPVPWMSQETPLPPPPTHAERPRKTKKSKRVPRDMSATPTPPPPEELSPSPSPPEKVTVREEVQKLEVQKLESQKDVKQDTWVFGEPIEGCEQIFVGNNGQGDVAFGEDGSGALAAAMRDGLMLEGGGRGVVRVDEEGIFEDDAEMLDFE